MKLAPIMKKDNITNDYIILANKRELEEILSVFFTFCQEHKKRRYAKKMLKQFEDELAIF